MTYWMSACLLNRFKKVRFLPFLKFYERSSGVERSADNRGVDGSNPSAHNFCGNIFWGLGANGNTSVLHSEIKGSIPLASRNF